jgi:diguanylate cyclase (GGDEF)-like protein
MLRSSSRVLVALGGLTLLAVVVAGSGFWVTDVGFQDVAARTAVLDQTAVQVAMLADAITDEEVALADLLLTGQPDALVAYEQAAATEQSTTDAIPKIAAQFPTVVAAEVSISANLEQWHQQFADPVIAASSQGTDLSSYNPLLGDWHEKLDSAKETLSGSTDAVADQLAAESDALAGQRVLVLAFALLVAMAAAGVALTLVRRFGRAVEGSERNATVVNRFTEVTSFAADDTTVARSTLEALDLLVRPDASVVHVLNRSQDRAVPEAFRGDAQASVLPLHELSRCAGVQRGGMFVAADAAAPLSVHCPIYPVDEGTLVCIALSSGELVGSVHLYWKRSDALPIDLRAPVARIAEHAALAVNNRRLLAVLQGQASTDPRTGLANMRAFEDAARIALENLSEGESLAVLMLDVDHFKDFNDRYGHPAGDDALRALAGVLRSCMRQYDVAARYGGEEFAVLLAGTSKAEALTIAERIRLRTESTILSLAPGVSSRLTVSIGVATAPDEATERLALLRAADQALYRAKERGRNMVVAASSVERDDPIGSLTDDHEFRPRPLRPAAASKG